MKKHRLTLLVVLVLALAAAFLVMNRSKGTLSRKETAFAVDDTATITRIFMADKSGHSVTLSRDSMGGWKVNEQYAARRDAIDILLKTLTDIEVMEPVAKAAHDNIIRRIAASGVKVEIYQHSFRIRLFGLRLFPHVKLTKVYYVGSQTQDNLGTYAMMEGARRPYVTYLPGFRGFISVRYSPRLADWRDHTIFSQRIGDIRSVKTEFVEVPGFSYRIDNKDGHSFTVTSLADGKTLTDYDTVKMLDYLTSFMNIKFEALLDEMDKRQVDSVRNSRPFHIITLTDMKGKEHVVRTFHRRNPAGDFDENGNRIYFDRDRMYAVVNDGRDFVLVQFFVFDNILKPIGYFMKTAAE